MCDVRLNHIDEALGWQVVDGVSVPSTGLIDTLQCVADALSIWPASRTVLRKEDFAEASIDVPLFLLSPTARADGIAHRNGGRRVGIGSLCMCEFHARRQERRIEVVGELLMNSLVVGKIPHMPELSVHLSLKTEVRLGHVLYVFEGGHGCVRCLKGHGWMAWIAGLVWFLVRPHRISILFQAAFGRSRKKPPPFLFLFLYFSYVVLSFLLDEAEFFLDVGPKGAGELHERARDAGVLSKAFVQLPGLVGERAEAFKDERNRIHHVFVTVDSELSLFVLVAILNRPAHASEPRNGLSGQLVRRVSAHLEKEDCISNGVIGIGSSRVQRCNQRLGISADSLLLGGRRAHQRRGRLGGSGHGSDAGGATARSSSRHGWTGGFGFYQGDMRLQFFYKKKKMGFPFFSFSFFFLCFFLFLTAAWNLSLALVLQGLPRRISGKA